LQLFSLSKLGLDERCYLRATEALHDQRLTVLKRECEETWIGFDQNHLMEIRDQVLLQQIAVLVKDENVLACNKHDVLFHLELAIVIVDNLREDFDLILLVVALEHVVNLGIEANVLRSSDEEIVKVFVV